MKSWSYSVGILFFFVLSFSYQNTSYANEDSQFFPQTNKTISGKFLKYWRENGGLTIFGYPITEAQPEVDPETGKTFLIQWFERNRFELHPEKAGTRFEVLLGLLGKDLRREALVIDPDFARAIPDNHYSPTENWYLTETGHNLRLKFLDCWLNNGGVERFGYPLSEEYQEVDPQTGNAYIVQWFERARFELHPENANTPYEVLLGLLGNQIKKPNNSLEYSWKFNLKSSGITEASGILVDSQNNFYVSENKTSVIYKFNKNGQLLTKWGGKGSSDGKFESLTAITFDKQNNLLALDDFDYTGKQHIKKFDRDGNYLGQWATSSAGSSAYSIAVDQQNNIYLATYPGGGNGCYTPTQIEQYDTKGNFLAKWGSEGTAESTFSSDILIAADQKNNLYVVQVNSCFIGNFGSNMANYLTYKFGNKGHLQSFWQSNEFMDEVHVTSVAIDTGNYLYFNEYNKTHYQLVKYTNSGQVLWKFGSPGDAAGQLSGNIQLWVDSSGNIYVLEIEKGLIQKFRQF